MAVRLRLARHGRKRKPHYYIVAADGRSPRDGKFIEKIGSYNPMTNPATINLDVEKALTWLKYGAQPSDTVKRIMSYKGVYMKKHLYEGVKKGAFDEITAEKKFNAWLEEKEQKIRNKVSDLELKNRSDRKTALAAETKINELRAAEIAKKHLDALGLEEEKAENQVVEIVEENTNAVGTTEVEAQAEEKTVE